ncbi:MAG: GTPase Era [Chloroflexi bacterium]|nr:GTPase Era [Chloroflexota bacterium]
MNSSTQPSAPYRSGFVAVIGRPNVGKSTLLNALLGQKIAIVTPKPQTTRNRLLGILTRDDAQVIFVDTPGIHRPLHRLGEIMVQTAAAALPDADVVVWVVDASRPPTNEDREVAALLALGQSPARPGRSRGLAQPGCSAPVILALNKCDLAAEPDVAAAYIALAPVPGEVEGPQAASVSVSATTGHNLDRLLAAIIAALPPGPRYYPEDAITDQQVRFMAGELVREQALLNLREEVPHAVAVLVDDFKERSPEMTYISAVIYVERESQRMILLGKGGQMLKTIGQAARQSIEELLETKVYLELWVKVRPKWRKSPDDLRQLGYQFPRPKAARGGARPKRAIRKS